MKDLLDRLPWRRAEPAIVEEPAQEAEAEPRRRVVEVGWAIDADKAGFIWDAPRRAVRDDPSPPANAKGVNYCPSVLDHESRLFEVPCPISVRLRLVPGKDGMPALTMPEGEHSPINAKRLNDMVTLTGRSLWRHPNRPVIQFTTPYLFIADEPVFMSQVGPYNHYQREPWPGLVIGGRLPIHVWPRMMIWAFEWWDGTKELVLKRGEPWFYVRFEVNDPTRPMRLFEAALTPELNEYRKGMIAVAGYVDQTYSLFKTAESRRPKQLLVRKER